MRNRLFRTVFEILLGFLVILIAALAVRAGWLRFYRAAYPLEYEQIVLLQSEINGLDPALVFAIIRTESGFNPTAQSPVPARGLMQITEDTFEWARWRTGGDESHSYEDLFDPETNVHYGTALLRLLSDELGPDRNILCAYHAGRTNALNWAKNPAYAPDGQLIENIPFGDTGRYVEKVLETRDIYKRLYF